MLRTALMSASIALLVALSACKGDEPSGNCTGGSTGDGGGGSCAGNTTGTTSGTGTFTGTGTGQAPTGHAACVMEAGASVLFCLQYVASPTGGKVEAVHKENCTKGGGAFMLEDECPAGYFGCCIEKDSASGHFKSCYYAAAGEDPAEKKQSCEEDGDTWEE